MSRWSEVTLERWVKVSIYRPMSRRLTLTGEVDELKHALETWLPFSLGSRMFRLVSHFFLNRLNWLNSLSCPNWLTILNNLNQLNWPNILNRPIIPNRPNRPNRLNKLNWLNWPNILNWLNRLNILNRLNRLNRLNCNKKNWKVTKTEIALKLKCNKN